MRVSRQRSLALSEPEGMRHVACLYSVQLNKGGPRGSKDAPTADAIAGGARAGGRRPTVMLRGRRQTFAGSTASGEADGKARS